MSAPRRVLLFGGLALAIWGMGYGLWYALFAEHQALNGIGTSLAGAFTGAAQRNAALVGSSLQQYKKAKFVYDRQVDVHSHWIGLAMLLITLAIYFDRLSYSDKGKALLAWGALLGAAFFPFGVLLQIYNPGPVPWVLAVLGAALEITTLFLTAMGFVRRPSSPSQS